MINQDKQARLDLAGKKFTELAEVQVLQERIRVMLELRAHIDGLIRKGKEERVKMDREVL